MPISLRAARVDAGYTQEQVAEIVGLRKNTIASYEMYRTIPDVATAKKLAELYNRSVDDIIWCA